MDSSNRLRLALFAILLLFGCKMNLEDAVAQFKEKYGGDPGIYSINPADRFGHLSIAVSCIAKKDVERLGKIEPDSFQGYPVHFTGPAWGIGGLVRENKEKFQKMLQDQRYFTSGTPESKLTEEFVEAAVTQDSQVWESWSDKQRADWTRDFILEKRKGNKTFANCGDKFLLPD
jgi:hypothetical protein